MNGGEPKDIEKLINEFKFSSERSKLKFFN